MCYLKHVCCLCLINSNKMTHYLFKAGETIMTYYEKLSASLPQLVFKKNYDDYMLCEECCKNINSVYEFSNRCIKNLNTFLDFKRELRSSHSMSCATNIRKEDPGEKAINYKKSIEQRTRQGNELMVHRNMTENETLHSINNLKGQVDEDYVCTQKCNRLESDNEFGMKIKLGHDLETKPLGTRHDRATDVVNYEDISGAAQGDTEIKIEEDEKAECLDYEFIACDDIPTFCELTEDDTSVHNQLAENSSRKHTDHRSAEIQSLSLYETNTTRYKLGHTSLANQSRAKSDTYSSEVDILRIHKSSSSEEEGSKQSSSLIAHSLLDSSYACGVLNMQFQNLRNLVKHKAVHTDHKPHVCGICKNGFKKCSHLVTSNNFCFDRKAFVCDICNKEFTQASNLATHKVIHTGKKPYVCDSCKKGFSQASALIRHKRIHTGQKPYVCDICNKTFRQAENLTRHKRIHTGDKPYVCDICNSGYSRSSDLVVHKYTHTGQKPYVCDICQKGFSQSSTLVIHKYIHTGQKPYVCEICKKGFNQSSALVNHKRIHTGLKPYACDICNKKFRQTGHLVAHKQIHTGQNPHV